MVRVKNKYKSNGLRRSLIDETRNSKLKIPKMIQGVDANINMKVHYHENGMGLLWTNNSQDLTLNEEMSFNLKNAVIDGYSGNALSFSLGPGQEKFVEIKKTGNEPHKAGIKKSTYNFVFGNSNC
jgi:hypothetical protein